MEERQEFSSKTLNKINKIIDIAHKYNGKIFGGFVRDVIVPRLKDPSSKVYFKDVDIWFINKYNACDFVNEMNQKYDFKHQPQHSIDKDDVEYPFTREQYHLYKDSKCLAWFDIVISETFPVNDFDVNFLSYCKGELKSEHKSKSKEEIIAAINRKEMTITDEYYQKASNPYNLHWPNHKSSLHTARIYHRYLKNGWTIIRGNDDDAIHQCLRLEMIKYNKLPQLPHDCIASTFARFGQPTININYELDINANNTILKQDIKVMEIPDKNDLKDKERLFINLVEAAAEYRKASEKWNHALTECIVKMNITDPNIDRKIIPIEEPTIFEQLYNMKK